MLQNKNERNERQSESGNVFLFIILGVALFATLSFTVARGFRSDNTSAMSAKQIDLAASDILNYTQLMSRSIDRLRRKGCSENGISFQYDANNNGTIQDIAADIYNPNAPTDRSCHVFESTGGKVSLPNKKDYTFQMSGAHRITDIGCDTAAASCADMTVAIKNIDRAICENINDRLGIAVMPTDDNGAAGFPDFVGTFTDLSRIGDADANLAGQTTACFLDSDDSEYIFYSVILIR